MNYKETLEYLYKMAPMFQQMGSAAYKTGLENTLSIASHTNNPHLLFHSIHVGGTNGKGSISHILSSIFKQSGYKTGLYTSPHLRNFRERVKIDGEMMPEQFMVDFVAEHKLFFEKIQPSFFELTTAMAFQYFAQEQVDIAIIEVGLGGRLDCTNIIKPDLCIISNISFDHTDILGNSIQEIAQEKAGIIKKETPIIIGESDPLSEAVFRRKAESENAPIRFADKENIIQSALLNKEGQWIFENQTYPNLLGQLGGLVQQKNAASVLCAIEELIKIGYKISPYAVCEGFAKVVENTGLQGRWQQIGSKPRIIVDTAHNVGGLKYVVQQLQGYTYANLHIVFGMVNDKDISSVLDLLPKDAIYYFAKADIPRALDHEQLRLQAASFGLIGDSFSSVKAAVFAAKSKASKNDIIFVGGSTFVVADFLELVSAPS